jgi:hypothetical protein
MKILRGCRRSSRVWAAWCVGALCLAALVSATGADTATKQEAATATLAVGGVTTRVDFRDTDFTNGTAPLRTWIERSIRIVAEYYDGFPVTNLHIRVVPVDGAGVQGGTTWGAPEHLIRVHVGRKVTEPQLMNDWVLVHEMVHLALPDVGEGHAWLSEGLATYVEAIARVQAGKMHAADAWSGYARSMHHGLPKYGDEGLDRTHTWGRTYWGGAMFCLMADVDIRTRTGNKSGLQSALRAVARKSGGLGTDWPITRVLETGDEAVGVSVLSDLYEQMKDAPVSPDLNTLWKRLGVELDGNTVKLSDDAPLAAVREAIMQRPGS